MRKSTRDSTRTRKSIPSFQFDQRNLKNYGTRTGLFMGEVDPKKNFDGFARYSDYITYGSEEIPVPDSTSKDSLPDLIPLLPENSDDEIFQVAQTNQSVKEKQSKPLLQSSYQQAIIDQKHSATQEEPNYEFNSHCPTNKVRQPSIEVKTTGKQGSIQYKPILPEIFGDISSVKKNSNVQTNRKSQYALYKNLLNEINEGNDYRTEEEEDFEAEQRQSKYFRTKPSTKKEEEKNKMVVEKEKKRVTISEKDRIFLPTDTVSVVEEFEFVLPDSLKKSSYEEEIELDKQEEIRQTRKQDKEEHPKESLVEEEKSTKEKNEEKYINEAVKKEKKYTKKRGRQAVQRVSNPKKSNPKSKSKAKSKPKSKPKYKPKSKPKIQQKQEDQSDSQTEAIDHVQSLPTSLPAAKLNSKKQKKLAQANKVASHRGKGSNESLTVEKQAENNSNDSNVRYPKRTRVPKVKFWECQKVKYRNGIVVRVKKSNIIELLNIKDLDGILFNKKGHGTRRIVCDITIPAKKKLSSEGFSLPYCFLEIFNHNPDNEQQIVINKDNKSYRFSEMESFSLRNDQPFIIVNESDLKAQLRFELEEEDD